MHRRHSTNGLNTKQVKQLTQGWKHANRIRLPLNAMISIRPFDAEDLSPAERCKLASAIRNKLGVFARQHGFPFVAAWSRECNEDGTGEHLHVLMHVPKKHFAKLTAAVIRWYPEPVSADVRPAHQNVTFTDSGCQRSAIGYIAKQMTPQAWFKRGLTRKRGGPVFGKRGGVTRNIAQPAIDQYFEERRARRREFDRQNGGQSGARNARKGDLGYPAPGTAPGPSPGSVSWKRSGNNDDRRVSLIAPSTDSGEANLALQSGR